MISTSVPKATRNAITITNDCVAMAGTVSLSIENGLLVIIIIFHSKTIKVSSTVKIIDQPLYLGQFVTAC